MDHDRYGLDGMPISCRSANSDPVTGLPFPQYPENGSGGIPYLRPILAAMMVLFLGFFAWASHLIG